MSSADKLCLQRSPLTAVPAARTRNAKMPNSKSTWVSYDLVHGSSSASENARPKAGSGGTGKFSHGIPNVWVPYQLMSFCILNLHRSCITPTVIQNLLKSLGGLGGIEDDPNVIDGYDEMPREWQEKILTMLREGHVPDEDWKGVGDPDQATVAARSNRPPRTLNKTGQARGVRIRRPRQAKRRSPVMVTTTKKMSTRRPPNLKPQKDVARWSKLKLMTTLKVAMQREPQQNLRP
jgi:hypothetical protein